MKQVHLIGAGSGWGAGVREAEDGPRGLQEFGLAERLAATGVRTRWAAMVEPTKRWSEHGEVSRPEVFDIVARHNASLADAVARSKRSRALPVVLGGDHAIAMGTWGGVAKAMHRAPLGLIWMDAHLDAHTVETTPSMNPHGMSAAVLLGHGAPEFLAIGGHAIRPEHLCYIGIRSYEVAEWALLRRLGVRIFYMDEVKERGLAAVMREALAAVTHGTRGFGVTIDLDGFDPADVPGVGLPVADGLRGSEAAAVLRGIARDPRLQALELVDYAPALDRDHRTARLVLDLLSSALAPARACAAVPSAARAVAVPSAA